ncbi:hypothetical protein [Nonomuraea diastatica]|uniref:Uncharacterized protein n=1 Tax=Nonomuraea diastatica TaxID=1848329 RepID=A0A4R4WND8_9ACTN|nr:hypothetical protein [Nonomuraea diastatica]TDD15480.1 hypothetical protein E1294_34230 [Nonomuraea diastatica]
MTIEKRAALSGMLLALGGILLLYCGFGALGSIQHAWHWSSGEPVDFQVTSESCGYMRKSGTLSGCEAAWTTADGTRRTGALVGNVTDLGHRDQAEWRASGEVLYAKPTAFTDVIGRTAPFAGGLAWPGW